MIPFLVFDTKSLWTEWKRKPCWEREEKIKLPAEQHAWVLHGREKIKPPAFTPCHMGDKGWRLLHHPLLSVVWGLITVRIKPMWSLFSESLTEPSVSEQHSDLATELHHLELVFCCYFALNLSCQQSKPLSEGSNPLNMQESGWTSRLSTIFWLSYQREENTPNTLLKASYPLAESPAVTIFHIKICPSANTKKTFNLYTWMKSYPEHFIQMVICYDFLKLSKIFPTCITHTHTTQNYTEWNLVKTKSPHPVSYSSPLP